MIFHLNWLGRRLVIIESKTKLLQKQLLELDEKSVHIDWYYKSNLSTNGACIVLKRMDNVLTNTITIWHPELLK
jgi:hypothetical protein